MNKLFFICGWVWIGIPVSICKECQKGLVLNKMFVPQFGQLFENKRISFLYSAIQIINFRRYLKYVYWLTQQ